MPSRACKSAMEMFTPVRHLEIFSFIMFTLNVGDFTLEE